MMATKSNDVDNGGKKRKASASKAKARRDRKAAKEKEKSKKELLEIINSGHKFLEALETYAVTTFKDIDIVDDDTAATDEEGASAGGGAVARRKLCIQRAVIQYCAETGKAQGHFASQNDAAIAMAKSFSDAENRYSKYTSGIYQTLHGITPSYMGRYFQYADNTSPLPAFPIEPVESDKKRKHDDGNDDDGDGDDDKVETGAKSSRKPKKRKVTPEDGPVLQFCIKTGEQEARYETVADAERAMLTESSTESLIMVRRCVNRVLVGSRKSYLGRHFRLEDDDGSPDYRPKSDWSDREIVQFCANTGAEEARYPSEDVATESLVKLTGRTSALVKTSIRRCLRGMRQSYLGHCFAFADDADKKIIPASTNRNGESPRAATTRPPPWTGAARFNVKQNNFTSRPVVQYCADTGEVLGRYDSVVDASEKIFAEAAASSPEDLDVARIKNGIGRNVTGTRKTYNGLYFRYVDDTETPMPTFPINAKNIRGEIIQYCANTGEKIDQFGSIMAAAQALYESPAGEALQKSDPTYDHVRHYGKIYQILVGKPTCTSHLGFYFRSDRDDSSAMPTFPIPSTYKPPPAAEEDEEEGRAEGDINEDSGAPYDDADSIAGILKEASPCKPEEVQAKVDEEEDNRNAPAENNNVADEDNSDAPQEV